MTTIQNKHLCVYVAGAYSSDNVLGVLGNIRRGLDWSKKIWLAGYAPFCPWADHLMALQLSEDEAESLSVKDYYDASEAWLKKADVLFVTPGWENSKGTLAEIALAEKINLPVVYDMADLKRVADVSKITQNYLRKDLLLRQPLLRKTAVFSPWVSGSELPRGLVDVVWNDGLIGVSEEAGSINWDDVVAWAPTKDRT